jgi:filamentous hemagglutinin family protein
MNHHNNKNNGLAPDKRPKRPVSIADALLFVLLIHAPITFALPVGNELVSGSVQVTAPNASQLIIHQGSQQAIVNWQGFSIGQHESVTIQQPNVNSALLNRVIGQDASNIQGKLTANGQVFLINANGVIFNKTAQVDVGSLIVSTLNISNQNFLANNLHFTEDSAAGRILNAGQIKASAGGVIALIGEQIQNLGTLQASGGTVALAAGKTIDLDMQGQGLVEVKIPEAALKAQILNHGVIDAKGGAVSLTAKAAGELLNTVINNQGVIQAQGMAERNGKIVLSGSEHGLVEIGGTLDASAKGNNAQGGSIQVNGAKVDLQDSAKVLASGTAGGGAIAIGDKQITSQTTVNAGATVSTEASEHGKAGSIAVLANMDNGLVTVAGKLNASAPKLGDGGAIDTSAAQVKVTDSAQINTHAANGKTGSWLIDPTDYIISASGGDISGTTLASNVVNNNVTIESTTGATGVNGDILVNDTVNYASANSLTLNAVHNVRVNNTITNSGAGTVNLRADSTGACVAGAVNCGKVLFSESGHLTANAVNIYTNPANSNLPADADGNGPDYLVQTNYLPNVTANTLISYMLVNDVNQLQAINTSFNVNNVVGNYALGKDINAAGTQNWNNSAGFMPIGNSSDGTLPFNGKFDGLGHTITRLFVNRLDMSNVGLFAKTTGGSKISNVTLLEGNINGFDSVGGLVGENTGTIDKASYSGSVYGDSGVTSEGADSVGGLVGLNSGNIVNSNAHGSVTGNIDVGGLVGFNNLGNISASYADANITGIEGFQHNSDTLGGLVGRNSGSISNSFATGAVDGLVSNSINVGGLVGINLGSVVNAYATGNSNGITNVGGLIGKTESTSVINNAYASGTSTGNVSIAGLIGRAENGSVINNSFWNITTSGQNIGVGFGAAPGVTGKTNAQMQQLSTFTAVGWDIDNAGGSEPVWRIYNGFTSSLLRSFLTPLTVTANNITKTYDGQPVSSLDGVTYSTPINIHFKTNNDPYIGAVNASVTPYQPSGLYSDQLGFDISVTNGQLTINPATLTYTANPANRVYGANNPVFAGTVTGLVNAELLENVTQGVLGFSSNANNASNVGNYAINGSGLNAVPGNYVFAQAPGNATALTVAPAALTATITGSPVKTYNGTTGAVLTAANYNLAGFVAGEGANVTQTVGSYNNANVAAANTINANLVASNYTPTGETNLSNYLLPVIASGAGTITPAALTITANNDHKTANGIPYSGGNGVTYTGFVNEETENLLLGQLNYGGTSQGAVLAGNYAITPSGLSAVNYNINFIDGQLSIVNPPAAPPTVLDNTVTLSKSVTYQAPISTMPVPSQTQAGFSMAVLKDTTADYTGNTLVSCDDFQLPGQSQRLCQKLQKNGNLIIPILKVKNSAGRVKHLQMSANKQFLSLLLEDGSVRVWDFVRGDQHQIVPQQKSQVMTDISAVNDSGDLISIANQTGIGTQDVIIPTLDTNQTVNEPDIHQFTPSNDGSLLLVSSGSNQLSLWSSKQNQKRWQVPYERGVVAGLSMNENKQYGAVLSRQPGSYVLPTDLKLKSLTDAVNIIDLDTGKIIKLLPNVGEQILSIQFTDNDTLQLKLASGEMLDWSVKSNSPKTVANFDEPIRAVDTQTKNYAYVLEDGTVRVGDGNSKVLLSVQNNQNPFTDALILDAGKKLLTVMANGELSLWDVPSGKKLLRLFSTKQGWTVMDAYGRFDGSEAAMENFSWLANENDIPLNNFSENYYEPGLLSNVLQNKDYLNTNPYGLKNGLTLPPKVELQIAEQTAQDNNLTVQMDVFDRGGGIDNINVYHNGKLLNLASVLVTQKNQQENGAEHQTLMLKLLPGPGKNTLKATANNDMGIENSSAELSFDGKTKAYASSIRLLTIGIDQYSEPRLKLNYSVSDAESIAASVSSNSKTVASVNLYNENATKPKILAQLNELSQGSQQDVLIIYFAGHGLAVGKEWYFLPYETKIQPTPAQIAAMGITATELSDIFKNSKIQHILLMVDSCYSGAGMDAFSKLQNGQRYFTRQLSRTLGITVMTATTKDQQAFELKSLGHGLFTYLITQELQKTDAAKAVTAHGVAQNIAEALPVFSKKMLGAVQEPAVYTNGNDFMLTGALNRPGLGSSADHTKPLD